MLLREQRFSSGLFPVRFGYVWQDLRCCISVTRRFFNPLGFSVCLSLISGVEGWNEGHAGFRPTCLLWGLPPLFPTSFLWRIFHIFVRAVVLGTGRLLGTWEPLWHSWILSYSTHRSQFFSAHLRYFYGSKPNSVTVCHHLLTMLLRWTETWSLLYITLILWVQP